MHCGENIEICVYHKPKNIYLYTLEFIFPTTWKWCTLENMALRVYNIRSNEKYIILELHYLCKVLHEQNRYPHWFITHSMKQKKNNNVPCEQLHEENEHE